MHDLGNGDHAALTATVEAINAAIAEDVRPWLARGLLTFESFHDGAGVDLRPANPSACPLTIYVQSDAEVSFFPTAPGTDRTPTLDVFDAEDRDRLVDEVRRYLRAFATGDVELTLRKGGAAGRVRVWLDDGRTETHLYNVILGVLVGRGPLWDRFRSAPWGSTLS